MLMNNVHHIAMKTLIPFGRCHSFNVSSHTRVRTWPSFKDGTEKQMLQNFTSIFIYFFLLITLFISCQS